MLSFYKKSAKDGAFELTSAPEEQSWIYAEGADGKDLQTLCDLLKLQVSDLNDALDYHELPRLDFVQDCLVLFARYPADTLDGSLPGHLHTLPVTLILSPVYFATVALSKSLLLQEPLQKKENPPCSLLKCFLSVLKRISYEFGLQIKRVRNSVMAQSKEMHAVESEDIFRLTEQEEILNQYLSSLHHLTQCLEQLESSSFGTSHKKAKKDLTDIINSVKQSENICSFLIKNIRSLRDSYQIIFANKLTKTIKLLTSLTIIFSVPTMIASIYGMNLNLPFAKDHHAFTGMIFFMGISSLLCAYWFYRKKWI